MTATTSTWRIIAGSGYGSVTVTVETNGPRFRVLLVDHEPTANEGCHRWQYRARSLEDLMVVAMIAERERATNTDILTAIREAIYAAEDTACPIHQENDADGAQNRRSGGS